MVNTIALRNLLAIIVFVIVLFVAFAATNDVPASTTHGSRPVPLAICDVFGERHCAAALEVAWCESRFNTDARNGQYRGIFQMGSWERRTFGHGHTAEAQARAAERYFIRTGRDWSPWSCRTAI